MCEIERNFKKSLIRDFDRIIELSYLRVKFGRFAQTKYGGKIIILIRPDAPGSIVEDLPRIQGHRQVAHQTHGDAAFAPRFSTLDARYASVR